MIYKFQEVVSKKDGFLRGPFGSALKKSLFVPKGNNTYKVYEQCVPLEQNEELGRYYISKEYFDEAMFRFETKPKDFLVSCSGVNYGAIYQLSDHAEKGVLNQALLRIRLNNEIIDDNYFLFLFKCLILKKITSGTGDSTIPNFRSMDVVKNIEFDLPSLSVQKKIGEIFKNIENKIKNNNKIINELELMSKTLYDYWFLQFEFPNEKGKPYKSSGGKMIYNEELKRDIPEGWEVEKLGNVCDLFLGGTPSRKNENFWNGNINWLNSGEVADFPIVKTEEKITDDGLTNSATKLMKKGTVVISITGNIRTSILGIDSCANQSVVGIEENHVFKKEYLYPLLSMLISTYTNISTGNCQQHINKQTLEESYVLIPEPSILNSYYSKTSCTYDMIITKAIENKELASLRDFLLPMLMNGQVRFKED